MQSEMETRQQICEIGRRLYGNGFCTANDGNISARIGEDRFLCSPTGVGKGFMTPDMICAVDAGGDLIQPSIGYRPSSEIKMHLRVYNERPDVKAVVHAHPPYATGHAIAGIPLSEPIMAEAVVSLGCVPVADYGAPSTEEIPNAVAKYLRHFDAVLLENHGALSYGPDLTNAFFKMESLEFYAKLLFISKTLGTPRKLTGAQLEKLYALRREMGWPDKHPPELCREIACGQGCPRAR
jgi:L-fuculose-phosphate aldolase